MPYLDEYDHEQWEIPVFQISDEDYANLLDRLYEDMTDRAVKELSAIAFGFVLFFGLAKFLSHHTPTFGTVAALAKEYDGLWFWPLALIVFLVCRAVYIRVRNLWR